MLFGFGNYKKEAIYFFQKRAALSAESSIVETYCYHVPFCALETDPARSRVYSFAGYLEPRMMKMTGYRNNYNVSVITDANNATCEQVTTQISEKGFTLKIEMLTALDNLTMTAVLGVGDCLDFPATMVYTEGDQSAMLPYHNNPSFCDNAPGKCVFECDCSATKCRNLFLTILSAPYKPRKLCEIFIT